MGFSIKFIHLCQDGPLYTMRVTEYNFQKYHISLKMDFVLANSADPDEMCFTWVFTVCQSTYLGVSGLQRFNLSNT